MTTASTKIQSAEIQFALGLDVSKDTVTLYDSLTRRTLVLQNKKRALHAGLKPFVDRGLAVCEATGGYEDTLLAVLFALGIPAHRADAAKVKWFIKSRGGHAKTDAIDAARLAEYGLDRHAELDRWQPPSPNQQKIEALVARRRDLIDIRTEELNRLKAPRSHLVAADIKAHIRDLDRRIAAFDRQIEALLAADRVMGQRAQTLRSIPGIGRVVAATLLAQMPELGTVNRRQAASLAGCAPHPRDSGKAKQYRATKGGRRYLRPPLCVAALAASRGQNNLADAYRNFVNAGKPKRVALVAVMRRIITIANAKLRDLDTAQPQLT